MVLIPPINRWAIVIRPPGRTGTAGGLGYLVVEQERRDSHESSPLSDYSRLTNGFS